jgi:VanZ family protein
MITEVLRGRMLRRIFLVLMLGGIFYLSHQPSLKLVPPLFPNQDKVFHAGEYFLLFLSMILNRDLCRGYHTIPILFTTGMIFAASDEIHQSFIPGRDCSLGDLAADISGMVLCLAMYIYYRGKHMGDS